MTLLEQFTPDHGYGSSHGSARIVRRVYGDELYVRAKVFESNGRVAWTQPVWRGPSSVR